MREVAVMWQGGVHVGWKEYVAIKLTSATRGELFRPASLLRKTDSALGRPEAGRVLGKYFREEGDTSDSVIIPRDTSGVVLEPGLVACPSLDPGLSLFKLL